MDWILRIVVHKIIPLQAALPSHSHPVIPAYEDETDEEPDVEDIEVDNRVGNNWWKHIFIFLV